MLARLAVSVLIAVLSSLVQATADDPGDLIARARHLCDRERVTLIVTYDMPAGQTAHYVLPDDRIDLNPASIYWHSPAERHRMRVTGVVSTWHTDHIIMHEIAHAKLYRQIGMARFASLHQAPLGIDPARAASVVSSYAATGTIEFAAEVYVGIWVGVKYPPDIIAYYESLWREP